MSAFRVFCGFDARQAEAAEVFAYSVRENASVDFDLRFLSSRPSAMAGFKRSGVTDFSYARFLAPAMMEYSGRAAFFDACDQLCLGDVAELADFGMGGKPVCVVKHPPIRPGMKRARSWSSVMLMDCAQLTWLTPSFVETAPDAELMLFARLADTEIGNLPPEWNVMVTPGDEPLIFEDTWDGQPLKLAHWSYLSNPNGGSWVDRSGSQLWAEWRDSWRAGQ